LPNEFRERLEELRFKPYRIRVNFRNLWTLAALTLTVSSAMAQQLSRQQGDSLERKIAEIDKNAARVAVRPKKTPLSELEINSYFAFNGKDKVPRGLASPVIHIIGKGQLAGRVLVDMDEFKRQQSTGGIMGLLSYLSGQVPITAHGTFRSQQGKGQFQLYSAEILGVPLPKTIVQELVTFFSHTPENPRGFDIDAPFNLPAKIREVAVNQGEAVVVQ
jgi:hypothetical protein